ncbi:hypothetical protein [Poseidonocella sedimentorum]|uniref:Uncharacterized protein n=1 Tax=Poseidonocella sedimentorum TaxID=871652 RepID=A0A1I6EN37_9RHOB|nr:hypothetical protein [Poseidonocella sedimentorum]SFR19037.1 hypothetical protein SAMN04515673_11544 [Poseidonocella sedimentorum]
MTQFSTHQPYPEQRTPRATRRALAVGLAMLLATAQTTSAEGRAQSAAPAPAAQDPFISTQVTDHSARSPAVAGPKEVIGDVSVQGVLLLTAAVMIYAARSD